MFIARSAARVRLARLAFLVVGLAPAVGLVAFGVHRRSDAHRMAIERRWQEALGIPLEIGGIEHPRPGVIRGRDCLVPATERLPAFELPLVEIESSADEDRIRVAGFACDAGGVAVLLELARSWLADEVRFRRTCIIEVADFTWADTAALPSQEDVPVRAATLRVECVARPGTRALRIVRQSGQAVDEVRVVRGSPTDDEPAAKITIEANCQEPVPLAVLVMTAGGTLDAATACGRATVTGTLEAAREAAGWSGTARGQIAGIDLATATAAVGGRGTGTVAIDVTRLVWTDSRVVDALLECVAGPGGIDGRLYDRIVLALGARPGPAAQPLPPGGVRVFDAAACMVGVGSHGVQVLPTNRLPAGLAVVDGAVLLAAPPAPVAADRIAWMLSAPGTAYGPAIGPGSWLLSVLPAESAPPPEASQRQF
jgi:hypothetical protein